MKESRDNMGNELITTGASEAPHQMEASAEVVVSRRHQFTHADFSEVFLTDENLVLNPENPIPLDYSAIWDTKIREITGKDLSTEAATRWAKLARVKLSTLQKYTNAHREAIIQGSIFGGFLAGIFSTGLAELILSTQGAIVVLGGTAMLAGYIAFSGVRMMRSGDINPILDASKEILDLEYKNRVNDWAWKRYGMRVDSKWLEAADRPVEDMAYVGTKDGKRVYCYETPSGWVLGDLTGELPVITKELIEA